MSRSNSWALSTSVRRGDAALQHKTASFGDTFTALRVANPRPDDAGLDLDGTVDTKQGWRVLRGCRLPGPLPCNLALVALHPQRGIALVDILPDLTPEPEPRLLQRLRRSGFDRIFGPAPPPVLHLALQQHELLTLDQVLTEAFRDQAPVNYPGQGAWVDMVARSLSPEMPLAAQPRPSAGRMRMRTPSRKAWWRLALILALLEVAVAAGLWAAWPSRPRPATVSAIPRPVAMAPEPLPGPPQPLSLNLPIVSGLPPLPPDVLVPPVPDEQALAVPAMPVPDAGQAGPVERLAELPPPPAEARPMRVAAAVPPLPPTVAAPVFVQPAALTASATVPRLNPRCQHLIQRIATGMETSEDERLNLLACRKGS